MRVKTWKIIDIGEVPEGAKTIPYECRCGYEAHLPIKGTPIAMTIHGIIFDNDQKGIIPNEIQCRKCGRIFTKEF